MSREIFDKLGLDLSSVNKDTIGFFRGLTTEFQKNVKRFNDKNTQKYFNNFIAALMLEFHRAYENFDIRIPYRIKSAKSAFDKILKYLDRPEKSVYEYNDAHEYQGRLNEDLTDMFAMTIVACNRAPTFFSNDPEINDLIEEKKRNHSLLGTMQEYKIKITDTEFSGVESSTYNYNNSSTKEEYYFNCILLINRIKTLIHPNATNLLKKYDDMLERIKNNIPENFFILVNSMLSNPRIAEGINLEKDIKRAYALARTVSNQANFEGMKDAITTDDVETIDFLELLQDFTARIHDKLDLAILKKQIYSVFKSSELIKKFGVTICPESEKLKRTESGYVSDFVFLDTPFGRIEMQLQSQHEHQEGNYGYSAHSDMDGKGFKEFDIPPRNNREKIKDFRKCVEFVSPKKFLAQFDSAEPNRILIQIFGKYQNYKSIMTQVRRGSESEKRLNEYFAKIYPRRNELFSGEARQEMIESVILEDLEEYFRSKAFKEIMKGQEENTR